MARTNYFSAKVECPHCHQVRAMDFDGDIGLLQNDVFQPGDLVIRTLPLVPRRGRHPIAVGPDVDVDWNRAVWAMGLARCPACGREVTARIVMRDRRFAEALPTLEPLELLAWGYLD